jgi:hypothetical protein
MVGHLIGYETVRTYTFEITVDHIVIVKDLETVTNVEELDESRENTFNTTEKSVQRSIRVANDPFPDGP